MTLCSAVLTGCLSGFIFVFYIAGVTPVCYSEREMTQKAAAKTTHSTNGNVPFGAGSVALTFLDTTWRIATPVVLFTLLGIYADLHLGSKPWLTLLSVLVGFGLAVLLVKRQIAAVQKLEDKK